MGDESGEFEEHGVVYHYRAIVHDEKDGSWTQHIEVTMGGVGYIGGENDTRVYRPNDAGAKYQSKPNMGVAKLIARGIIRAYHERPGREP